MPDKNEFLRRKEAEIKERLTQEALEEGVLDPGEVLVFTLRIDRVGIVQRESPDFSIPPDELSRPARTARGVRAYVGRARLTVPEIREIFALAQDAMHEFLRVLLVENDNRPTIGYPSYSNDRPRISGETGFNKRLLNTPIGGKYYQLIVNRREDISPRGTYYQVWEITKDGAA